jgi:hypothetical protein
VTPNIIHLYQNVDKARPWLAALFAVLMIFIGACKSQVQVQSAIPDLPECHIIFDAGSKGTRLYIYEQTADGWLKHAGPRTDALADPVRGTRGKDLSDIDQVVDDLVASVEDMRRGGFLNNAGNRRVPAFDWRTRCQLKAASVFATAGMRMAEQENAAASELLWNQLNEALSQSVGIEVTTRTISGIEEGLYSWLAIREEQADDRFGMVEMGGASVQLTYPCEDCPGSRVVRVKGSDVAIASYSFLGWGQDEAWKTFGSVPACARGAGKGNPAWQVSDCAASVPVRDEREAFSVGERQDLRWYLAGAFQYMQELDIEHFCRLGLDSGFEPYSSCFRAIYLEDLLRTLGVSPGSEKSILDWTLGAVVCKTTQCMAK